MSISVKVIADSIGSDAPRLTTLELSYPRFIHAEFMTHRMFSRNASSSRAIPTQRMHKMILEDPARPITWVMNEPGMQGYTAADEETVKQAEAIMLSAERWAIEYANQLNALGLHKQHVNRLTEPFQHIKVVVSSTNWENFFQLRRHEAAEPTMQALAHAMHVAILKNVPEHIDRGEWHLPYITSDDQYMVEKHFKAVAPSYPLDTRRNNIRMLLVKMSVARCARVSYNNFEGKSPTLEEDLHLYSRLVGAQPIHASPAEHQASPDWMGRKPYQAVTTWMNPGDHGNFTGWKQYRKSLYGESGKRHEE